VNRRDAAKLFAASLLTPLRGSAARPPAPLAEPAGTAGSPVRFSVMLWTLEKQASFDQCLELVAAAGYQGVELVGEFQAWTAADKRRILARMRMLGLRFDAMSGVPTGFALPDKSELFLQQFTAHIEAAHELECPQVILLSGNRTGTPGTQRLCAIENLKRAAEIADRRQIEIVIEPIDLLENPAIFLASVTPAFEIARAVNQPNLKVLYDLYHEQRSFGNLIEKLEQNIALVGLIHVADVPGRHAPGTGEINFPAIYRKLAELHYDRWIAMEFYPTTEPGASLRQARTEALASLSRP
jgi:hydroxypyruvate isomerase